MHSVSSGLHGILALNKIKYPKASEGLRPQDPLLQRFNITMVVLPDLPESNTDTCIVV